MNSIAEAILEREPYWFTSVCQQLLLVSGEVREMHIQSYLGQ